MRISPYSLSKSSHVRVVILCFLGFLPFSGVQASRASSNAQTNTQVSSSAIWNEDIINVPLSSSIFKNDKKESFRRVIQARLFHQGAWTLPGVAQTPLSIGRTLASLRPTFVTGLIRVPDYGGISNAEIEAFKVVRSAVNSLNKGCQFDLVVNAGDCLLYTSPSPRDS